MNPPGGTHLLLLVAGYFGRITAGWGFTEILKTAVAASRGNRGRRFFSGPLLHIHIISYDMRDVMMVFICSMKTSFKQLAAIAVCLVLLIAVIATVSLMPDSSVEPTLAVAAETSEQQLTFLRSLGYEAAEAPLEVKEVLIPDEPDETFNTYNELQKQAGYDLSGYHGKRVKCWTYQITDLAEGGDVQAHLYVYDGRLIGGDISSVGEGGFTRPLTKVQLES